MRPNCLVVAPASRHRKLMRCAFALLGAASIVLTCPHASAHGTFTLTSTSFRDRETFGTAQVYGQDGCKGLNESPELSWRNAPAGTRAFAVTIFDPDAPGPGWWHWAVARIPANVTQLPENASASGYLKRIGAIEARNDFDIDGYGGPCPPPGKPHRYVITVYALNSVDLRLAQGWPALMFDHEIGIASLASAKLVVRYGR
jgi:Raf kinase inhibitor-like YbhB/YbcL family protein